MSYISSKGQSGLGALISIGGITGAGGTEVFNVIGETMDIPFQRPKWKTEPTTNLQSTIEEITPVIPGLTSFSIKGNRVPNDAGQLVVETAFSGQPPVPYDFKLVLPKNNKITPPQTTAGDSFTWSAYVLGSNFSVAPDKILQFDVELQLVTLPVYTPGS